MCVWVIPMHETLIWDLLYNREEENAVAVNRQADPCNMWRSL